MTVAESARNLDVVSHTGLSGRGDALQVMVKRGYAYVGHRISRGISVVDVRDPRRPAPANFVPIHERSWSIHLQTQEGLLNAREVVHAADLFVAADGLAYLTDYDTGLTILQWRGA